MDTAKAESRVKALVIRRQWCELHLGECETVDVLMSGRGLHAVPKLACPTCLAIIKKSGLAVPGRWGKQSCIAIATPDHDPICAPRTRYSLDITMADVVVLRAMGYELAEDKEELE